MSKMYQQAFEHVTFNKVIDLFIKKLLLKYHGMADENVKIKQLELKKAGWIASILADSNQEEHKQKAQVFAILLTILHPNDISLNQLSYVIFSRMGNLVATKFLKNIFVEHTEENFADTSFKYNFSTVLDLELGFKRYESTVNVGKENLVVTNFQKSLWDQLNSSNNVSISAPTSSGKSFIIQTYLKKRFAELDKLIAVYIVPSKALLNQVSEEFHNMLDSSVEIRTAYIENLEEEVKINQKSIFILTPERCLKLLEQDNKVVYPDFIFIDEIQNVEEENGRGVLLEYVLEEMNVKWKNAQFISAGPFIAKNKELFNQLFKKKSENVETLLFPTLQLKTVLKIDIETNELILITKPNNQEISIRIPAEFNLKRTIQKSMGEFLTNLLMKLGKGQQNIIYAPRTDYAVKWSINLSDMLGRKKISSNVEQLIEFLAEEIHPQYYLIKCLQSKVAFHHGKLPELVRKEIENLFMQGDISYLFCTSTLLQGVNLPAKNLFVISPKKRNEELTPFEFGNLIGRAGRIKTGLFGMIYYLTRNKQEEILAHEYFENGYQKEVKVATSKILEKGNYFLEELKNSMDMERTKSSYTITLLKHKSLIGEQYLLEYLYSKDIPKGLALEITQEIQKKTDNIELPVNVLKLNPSIDPSLQEKLYKRIKEEGIENWVIHFNENFYKRIGRDYIDQYEFKKLSFYWQLTLILQKLDDIFNLSNEAYYSHDISMSIKSMAYVGFRWLGNRSYSEIIEDDLNFYAYKLNKIDINNEEHINKRINEIMNVNSKIVTFLLVKYFNVLTDILEFCMPKEKIEEYKFTLSLPIMLELGTTESIIIELISSGINRSVALKIFEEFRKKKMSTDTNIFEWLKNNGGNLELNSIYLKYLKELNYIR